MKIVPGLPVMTAIAHGEEKNHNAENTIKDEIRRIKASIGSICEPSLSVCVEVDFIATRVTWNQGFYKQVRFDKPIEADTAQKFTKKLRQLRVLDWGQRYDNPRVLDGTQWSVEVTFDDVCIIKGGSNAYPKEWDEFCRCIQDVAGRPFKIWIESSCASSFCE